MAGRDLPSTQPSTAEGPAGVPDSTSWSGPPRRAPRRPCSLGPIWCVLPAGTGQGRDRTHVLWDWKMGRRKQPLACLSHGDQGTTSLGSLCPSST